MEEQAGDGAAGNDIGFGGEAFRRGSFLEGKRSMGQSVAPVGDEAGCAEHAPCWWGTGAGHGRVRGLGGCVLGRELVVGRFEALVERRDARPVGTAHLHDEQPSCRPLATMSEGAARGGAALLCSPTSLL